MYMAFDLEPSKEVTGGVWYNEAQLDTAFIQKIKRASVTAVSQLAGRATPREVAARLKERGETTNPLKAEDVAQLMDCLVYEGWLDYADAGPWRAELFARPEKAEIAGKRYLIDEKVPKKKGRGANGGAGGGRSDVSDYLDGIEAGGEAGSGSLAGYGFGYSFSFDDGPAAPGSSSSSSSAAAGFSLEDVDEEGGDDEEGGAAGVAGRGAGGAGSSPADRYYVVARKHTPAAAPASGGSSATIGEYLTTTPCGGCVVQAQCVPGGLISPETCVYMSHWLQW